jgi:hypothetical protein
MAAETPDGRGAIRKPVDRLNGIVDHKTRRQTTLDNALGAA